MHCTNCEKKSGQMMCSGHGIYSCFPISITPVIKLASLNTLTKKWRSCNPVLMILHNPATRDF
jgi:hypothetical protein